MDWLADTQYLLSQDFVIQALIACALLGLLSGVMTTLIVLRRMSFAVHGTSELALMGASAALLFGLNVGLGAVVGAVVAAIVLALLGSKQQDSAVGVVMSFGLGLSVLFIHLYPGNSKAALSLLTGQIVGLRNDSLLLLALVCVIVVLSVAICWRPLLFASVDPLMAKVSGVPVRRYSIFFAVLVGLSAAQSVQIVGALLVMALLITPGAAAVEVTRSPVAALGLSVLFAEVSAVGGLVLSLAPGVPLSVFVTSISFFIYLLCRLLGSRKAKRATPDTSIQAAPGQTGCHH